ncbi:MAG: serine hydrolase [Candidatus Marinimicrobia bacterium]|nr:serine hydrolase [Candidatus Neomarinimicrobiota bacterium]
MKQKLVLFVLILGFLNVNCFAMSKNDSGLKSIQSDLKLLEIWINAQQEYRHIPGISVGLIYDQELIYSNTFGYADLEKETPLSDHSSFRIASISKTFTATALMQLRDAGKLRLDDPVIKYLPWFQIKQTYPDQPPITIRQLLTHTSGLPREAAFPYWTDHKFPTMDQIKATIADQETIFPPATRFKYSNLGLSLAGEIVSVVSGLSFNDYVKTHIFDPLGMNESTTEPDPQYQQRLVTPYSHRLEGISHATMDYSEIQGVTPAAGLATTIPDLAKYVSLQFREDDNSANAVLKGSSLKEMHRVQWLRPGWSSGWGLGWAIWHRSGKDINGHGGWVAGNRTQVMFIPEDKVGIVVFTNSDDGEPGFIARHILDFMGPVLVEAYAPVAEPAYEFDPAWEQYTGTYSDPWYFDTEIMILNQKLVMNTFSFPPEDEPNSEIIELTPEGLHTFRMTGDNGNGELVVFEFDDAGKIFQVKQGNNYIYPKEQP